MPGQFALQSRAHFVTFNTVRVIGSLLILLLGVRGLCAQEQETKLLDRLLKPNTSLKNPAQDKQFPVANAVSTDKRVAAPSVSFRKKTQPKTFPDQHAFTSKEIAPRRFPVPESTAGVAARHASADRVIDPPDVTVQVAPESGTTSPTRDFAGSRPFLAEGKSQKALRTKNKPLTIEQVRELLNKSK